MSATEQELRDLLHGCSCSDCNPEVYDNISELVQELLDLREANAKHKDRIAELERTRDAIQADANRQLSAYRWVHDKATEMWKLLNEIGYPTTGGDVFERATHAIRNLGARMKRNTRDDEILHLVQRWCRRPASVLREGATVLKNDADMWAKLRSAVL